MLNNKKIVVVMPAYNAEGTLEAAYRNIPFGVADEIILTDDCSCDNTVKLSRKLGIKTIVHEKNSGYGANQKTCYDEALRAGADVIIMLHPDFQYDPVLIPSLAAMIAYGSCDCAIASRFLLNSAKHSKMPFYKYISNRFLTMLQNFCFRKGLSEYHSGYRAFSAELLKNINYKKFDNGFIFDNQLLALVCYKNYSIGEISCPAKYFSLASSINFINSLKYGFGVLLVTLQYLLAYFKIYKSKIFS